MQTQRQDKPSGGRIPTVKAPPGRPGLTPPAAPKKRGKKPEQYAAESAAYRLAMRSHFAAIAAFNRDRCIALGIKNYEWIAILAWHVRRREKKWRKGVLVHKPTAGRPCVRRTVQLTGLVPLRREIDRPRL